MKQVSFSFSIVVMDIRFDYLENVAKDWYIIRRKKRKKVNDLTIFNLITEYSRYTRMHEWFVVFFFLIFFFISSYMYTLKFSTLDTVKYASARIVSSQSLKGRWTFWSKLSKEHYSEGNLRDFLLRASFQHGTHFCANSQRAQPVAFFAPLRLLTFSCLVRRLSNSYCTLFDLCSTSSYTRCIHGHATGIFFFFFICKNFQLSQLWFIWYFLSIRSRQIYRFWYIFFFLLLLF